MGVIVDLVRFSAVVCAALSAGLAARLAVTGTRPVDAAPAWMGLAMAPEITRVVSVRALSWQVVCVVCGLAVALLVLGRAAGHSPGVAPAVVRRSRRAVPPDS